MYAKQPFKVGFVLSIVCFGNEYKDEQLSDSSE